MPKPHADLQTMTKELAKFQIDRYKTVWEVAHTKYPQSVVKCRSRKRVITPQGEPRRKKKKTKNTGPLIFHADAIYKISVF